MILAAQFGFEEIFRLLIQSGVRMTGRTDTDILLGAAAENSDPVPARVFLEELGANPHARDLAVQTPGHVAACRSPRVLQLLVNHGADLDQPDGFGRTPRETAKKYGVELPEP